MAAFLYSLQHDLTPTLWVIGAVMFGAWGLAYAEIVRAGFRDKTYGLPLASIYLNVAWEFLYSFNIVAPHQVALAWGNRLWFFTDCVILLQVFMYGPRVQKNPWIARHFHLISIASLVFCGFGLYYFATYTGDVYGLLASFLMNLTMSIMFIGLLFSRPDLSGLPYRAAWTKMIGSIAGAAFCYVWWPMQFDASGTLVRPPFVKQPPNSDLLYFLYLTIPIFDLLYIHLYRQRRKELTAAAAAAPRHQAVVT